MNQENAPKQAPAQSQPHTKPNIDEILALRDAIMEEARRKVDPNNTGFDLQGSFAGGWGGWDWGERLANYLMAISVRVELSIISAGGLIASAHMFGTPAGERYATITLAASAVLAVWVAISAIVSQTRVR